MILWTVNGSSFEDGSLLATTDFVWFPTKPEAETYISTRRWAGEPELNKVRVPGDRAGLAAFLNHFAGN